jgi:hypothetical protein
MSKQTTFTVTFRCAAGVDGIRASRALLKRALRSYGLRAISAQEIHCTQAPDVKASRRKGAL